MQLSIVIRCYNEEQHIGRLLSGIMQQTVKDVEIILVDSGSTDATLSIASRFPVKIITISPEEFSFGRSLNVGCQAARGEFIVFASAHVYPVYDDWLERLLAPFEDSNVALVYGKQRGNEATKFSESQVFARWFPDRSNLKQEHPFCNNANAAIRRSLWEKIKYNERLTGLEDLDWANRVIKKGYYLAYVAEAEVVHVHSETWRQVYNRYRREAMAFKFIFPQETFHFWNFVHLWFRNVFHDYLTAMRERVFRKELFSIPVFRFMQFWGTYRGYAQHKLINEQLRQTFYYPNRSISLNLSSEKRESHQIQYDAFEEIQR